MKKVVVYFSDIMGTILGRQENTEEDYKNFNALLSKIKENEQADEVIFSLISTDKKELVRDVQRTIHPYIGQTVTYGSQFFENGYYTEDEVVQKDSLGKASDIIEYIVELQKTYEVVSVYYADDIEMYHELLTVFAEDYNLNQILHSIMPTENIGLSEINQLLESDIEECSAAKKVLGGKI